MDRIHAPPLNGLETLSLTLENVVVVNACCDDPVCNVEVSSHNVKIKAESSFLILCIDQFVCIGLFP